MAEAQKLRDTAEQCTRLAPSISDERMRSALLAVAAQSVETARAVDRQRWLQSGGATSPESIEATADAPDQVEASDMSGEDVAQPDATLALAANEPAQQPISDPQTVAAEPAPDDSMNADGIEVPKPTDGGAEVP
jgi:hypothetical protein